MNKTFIAIFFGTLTAAASFSASAQLPAWYLIKHPDARIMENMQAQEKIAAREAKTKRQLALHRTSNESHG